VVLLALCAGGSYTAYKLASDDNKTTTNPTTAPSAGPGGSATGSARPSGSPRGSTTTSRPPGGTGANPDTFVKGDCFLNEGTQSDPKLRKVPCTTAESYQVVQKVPFTTDTKRCETVAGADASYTMDKSPGTTGDYVLCLKKN
jgi:hypothetical protein